MKNIKTNYSTSRAINTCFMILAVVATAVQFLVDNSTDNLACAGIVLFSSLSVLAYLRWTKGFDTHPISTYVIFGFCATTQLGALLVQSASWTSLSEGLRYPLFTFFILAFYQIVAIAAHITIRFFTVKSLASVDIQPRFRRILRIVGLYDIPTPTQLWLLGFVGVCSIFIGGMTSDLSNRISIGITFLAWAPFLIPIFFMQTSRAYCNIFLQTVFLATYAVFIGFIGIAANARYMMFSGFATLAFMLLLTGMRSQRPIRKKTIGMAFAVGVIGLFLLAPVSQLATAMVVVRESQQNTTAIKTILATIDVLSHPELIEAHRSRKRLAAFTAPYDETYVDHPLLARFITTKFHDNALYFGARLTPRAEDELEITTTDLFLSILPEPVLRYFNVRIVKRELKFSMGDYLFHQATGGRLGGFKVGSVFGQGLGIFGAFFPIAYFFLCLISFFIIDYLAYRERHEKIVISGIGMLLMWRLYYYCITAESINGMIGFLLREIPQSIIIYLVFYQMLRRVMSFFYIKEIHHSSRLIIK